MIAEYLHHARQVPSLPLARNMTIRGLVEARRRAELPVTWLAVFIRAYALTAQVHPELRRAYLRYPYPRFYEHPQTVCTVPVEREVEGERVILGAKLRGPENMSLPVITRHLRRWRETPVLELSDFRQILRMGRAPGLWLRFAFWQTLHFSGVKRAKRFGTCIVSSLGKYGVRQIHPLTPLTTYFSAGPVSARGRVEVRCIYDHRVMDDGHVCRALVTLEDILNTTLRRELAEIAHPGFVPEEERPVGEKADSLH
jgi:hypothetical protein